MHGLLASHGDPLEAFELADGLLDAGAAFIQYLGEESRLLLGVRPERDNWADAAFARCCAVGRRIVSLIGHGRPRRDLRADVEQSLEGAAIVGLAACQMKGDGKPVLICF